MKLTKVFKAKFDFNCQYCWGAVVMGESTVMVVPERIGLHPDCAEHWLAEQRIPNYQDQRAFVTLIMRGYIRIDDDAKVYVILDGEKHLAEDIRRYEWDKLLDFLIREEKEHELSHAYEEK